MRGELVALDLETTGFDPVKDEIIEVGAVRFKDGEVIDTFSIFVNPGRKIPPQITQLTGIQQEDVYDAPGVQQVMPLIASFVGQSPWVAHNISFDASFLNHRGILKQNVRLDTYELASVIMPTAARYNLTSLTHAIGFDIQNAHRALFDAHATAKLYTHLWTIAHDIPFHILREITELAQNFSWDARPFFEALLHERSASPGRISGDATFSAFAPVKEVKQPLKASEYRDRVSDHDILDVLGPEGAFAQQDEAYENRPQQLKMATEIASAFNDSYHEIIEAGTGTGKSLAYLTPAALWAIRNNERVVVATNTINLQDQLIQKDIPNLQNVLDTPLQAAVMKGRSNYLCPRRLAAMRRRKPNSIEELRMLAKILVWLAAGGSGDRGEISLRGPDEGSIWNRLSAEDEGCTTERCRIEMGGTCPFYKARKAAEAAHIVIANHALLISDAMTESRVLPEYRHVIVDEAHHIEEAVTNGLSFHLDELTLRRRIVDLGGVRKGLLGSLLNTLENVLNEREREKYLNFVEGVQSASGAMEIHISRLFGTFREFLEELRLPRGEYLMQIRITPEVRAKLEVSQVQSVWGNLKEFIQAISDALRQLSAGVTKYEAQLGDEGADLIAALTSTQRFFLSAYQIIDAFVEVPDPNVIYWFALPQDHENITLHSAPLHIGSMLEEFLWNEKDSVILTSATLHVNGEFTFLQDRLHAQKVESISLGSPFNYKESTLVFVPKDMPEPTDKQRYQQQVERAIIELAATLEGRVLALFTSYQQLKQTAQAITPRLALGNISVFDQSDGNSRQTLVESFKNSKKAVLLGTRSFWEGVDIPGDSLSGLVIVRLPFTVPTDPVFAARSATYQDAFNQFTLPDALLRFRQGFGRLIRTQTDRGVVVILDSRVTNKNYGRAFIDALPDCDVLIEPLQNLGQRAAEWLK